jgi:YegS/Rv2252/BmrU family lipid kinase
MGAVFVSTLFDTFGIQQINLKIAFIINGSRKLTTSAQQVIDLCRADESIQAHVLQTKEAKEAIRMAEKCAQESFDVVIAVGGDGTVNEVLNGLMNSAVDLPILGVLPNGTGNDFVRGSDLNLDAASFINSLKERNVKAIDVAKVTSSKGTRHFINIADVGFGGKVVQVLDKQRRFIGGKASYALAIVRAFLGYKRPELQIITDDYNYTGSVLMVAICNGRIFGDGLTINPFAKMDDGKLNITLLGKVTLFDYVKNLGNLKSGKVIDHPEAIYLESRKISIKPIYRDAVAELDGELLETGEVEIEILPGKINLLMY